MLELLILCDFLEINFLEQVKRDLLYFKISAKFFLILTMPQNLIIQKNSEVLLVLLVQTDFVVGDNARTYEVHKILSNRNLLSKAQENTSLIESLIQDNHGPELSIKVAIV